ncbi:hypothetical protein [Chachezhania sediminis]|uniref:hypothetical protein n=1 Tax=Chachezhania sediminis TaxID=2599291 RepID=UPI00131B30EC|nr:hypothetical protein [Chachezhania sediminis]
MPKVTHGPWAHTRHTLNRQRRMPSGWWILPGVVLGLVVIFGGIAAALGAS